MRRFISSARGCNRPYLRQSKPRSRRYIRPCLRQSSTQQFKPKSPSFVPAVVMAGTGCVAHQAKNYDLDIVKEIALIYTWPAVVVLRELYYFVKS